MLNALERDMAREIAGHDWSDAPYRLDRAGHDRQRDTNRGQHHLGDDETGHVLTNVMWVTAQVLKYHNPDLDVHEFAAACGVPASVRLRRDGSPSGGIDAGIRMDQDRKHVQRPGAYGHDFSVVAD